jgi:TrmH family RNA methyltransferase
MITSTSNPKIKWIRNLQASGRARRQERLFIVEGVRLAEEALASSWPIRLILYTSELDERGQALLRGFAERGAPLEQVAPHVLAAASDTETPQGILVALEQCSLPSPISLDLVLIPDQIRDPGNLGTMLRTAAAAGASAVFLPPETVDPFSPKVVRSGMGAHFRIPIHSLDWDEIQIRLENLRIYLAVAGDGMAYTQADLRPPLAIIIGGEAHGASPRAQSLAQDRLQIPMPGGVESLNAAVSAGILLFEALRQRSDKS